MTHWREQAACLGHGVLFVMPNRFITQRGAQRRPILLAGMLMCSRCPVLDECTNWVISTTPDPCPNHVVAGMTPAERGRVKRQLGKAARRDRSQP